jgi:hypothetical protein
MTHAHLPRRPAPGSQTQVAAAVDGAAPVALEPDGEKIGRPPLHRPCEVQLEAGRAANHARTIVDLDRAPLGGWVGPRRAPWRRCAQRSEQRRRLGVRAGLTFTVAGATERPHQRRIDEAVGQRGRVQRGRDGRSEPGSRENARPWICVEAREIAARVEPRQPSVDLGKYRPDIHPAVAVAYDPRNRAHRREDVVEHVRPRANAVSRLPCPRRAGARMVPPCRRRTLAADPRSGRDSTGWSTAAAAVLRAPCASRCAPSAHGGPKRRHRRPPLLLPRASSATVSSCRHVRRPGLDRRACRSEPPVRRTTHRRKTTYRPRQLPRLPAMYPGPKTMAH